MNYLITDKQKEALERQLQELPMKYAGVLVVALNMLGSLPEIKEEIQPEPKPE